MKCISDGWERNLVHDSLLYCGEGNFLFLRAFFLGFHWGKKDLWGTTVGIKSPQKEVGFLLVPAPEQVSGLLESPVCSLSKEGN